jgi:peptidoglycan/xylan/chitin deacetylase (PgdA/CDA1 family)
VSPEDLLRQSFKVACSLADRGKRPTPGTVILLYHRVGRQSSLEVDLDPVLFDDQMAALGASGRVVALGDVLDRLTHPTTRADSQVVVTFDDGTADFADVALPIMVRHRVPATLYLATAFVEEGRSFPDNGAPLSWSALADACATGLVDVGSHTHTHRLLDRLAGRDVADELDRSIELIGERLGRAPVDFAYPKAVLGSPEAAREVRRRFRSAAIAGTRTNPYGRSDPYRLGRSPIQMSDGMRWFEHKAAGGMALEGTARRWVDRIRYARSTS